ncbi:SMI1/KNR4 family protein [Streptomyces sp. NPDC050145]|uniref:SMI1/KNR4 family protein n=1 Tax=Streptomyces sp. NPDC050145 TaxID=3365602 RepID=UPI00379CF833
MSGGDAFEAFDWQEFLGRWQAEWVPRADDEDDADGEEFGGEGACGPRKPAADEAAIAAAERRLGRRLPPSYREFLAVSDGWHVDQTAAVYWLGGVADIDWFQDPYQLAPLYEGNLGDDPREEDVLLAGMWRRALRLETDSDMSHALLDPGDIGPDGEWALYVHRGWGHEPPDRYPSFRAYMEAAYAGFHSDRTERPDFENATTRALDAQVDQALELVLSGRHEEAVPLLEKAQSFGRPRSRQLLNQVQNFRAPGSSRDYGFLVADPSHLPELLPLAAMAPARGEWRLGGDDHWLGMMVARGVARDTGEALLSALRDGTHRYAPPGAWGRAVAEAREAAYRGATDTAWRLLREALPRWEAPGTSLIAPIGLLADPVLGPLVTPERGREILATPRAGRTGPAPQPVPDLDPAGLAWLTEPARNRGPRDGYRGVWVQGADPADLPALIGEEGARLSAPVGSLEASRRAPRPHERDGVELWEDRAAVAVGSTEEGWAFAFDGHCDRRLGARFRSPAPAASVSGRAVTVWRDPRNRFEDEHPSAFHLSVAERGEELYAFTVRGAEIECSGAIPDALDPVRLCRPEEPELDRERRVLEALHAELGLSLPRFALTKGRLPTFTTCSWTRAPRGGEGFTYAYIGTGRPRR